MRRRKTCLRTLAGLSVVTLLAVSCTGDTAVSSSAGSAETTAPSTTADQTAGSYVCWSSPADASSGPISLVDSTEALGLVEPLIGIHGHAASFGDVDGDHHPDLIVGTFGNRATENYQVRGANGPRSDQLLLNSEDLQPTDLLLDELGRTSGSVFADLDGDGDDDLLLVRHAGLRGDSQVPTRIYWNHGENGLEPSEFLPPAFLGRTPAIADFDGDGLLDIYVAEDKYGDTGGLLYRNDGGMAFTDVTAGSGLAGAAALGATAADVNGDGLADLVTSRNVFVGAGDMTFTDATPLGYVLESDDVEDDPAGVAVGDVNRDGYADIVIGQHFRSTIGETRTAPVRLLLGKDPGPDGVPEYDDVTEQAGLPSLPTLAPHVAFADVDNDGWPDIVTSASAVNGTEPAILVNLGPELGFETPAGLGSDQYWVGAPVVDFDRDGRLDVFALEWEPSLPSLMFLNEGTTGNWLEVSVSGPGRGVGTVVTVRNSGGDLLGWQEIGVGGGYASGRMPIAHFGLGAETLVGVSLSFPNGASETLEDVPINSHIRWPGGCE